MKRVSIFFIISFLFILSCEDKKDTTPPELTIVSPTSGSTVGEIVQIKVQTTDESGILKVDFYIQNSMVLSDTTLPYEYEWNTTTNQDGEYKVKVVSFDTKENFVESEFSVTVDNESKKPQPVNIDTVYYDTEYMYLNWTPTTDIDFKTYNILYSDSQNGVREKIDSYDYQERSGLNLSINEYSPTKENWFFIEVVDVYGLSSIGQGKSNIQNLPPIKVNFEKVKYDVNQGGIRFEWKNTFEEDLKYLFILRSKDSNMSMTDTIYNTNPTGFVDETWKRDIRMDPDNRFYFKLTLVDIWNQSTSSDIYEFYEPIMFIKEIQNGTGNSIINYSDKFNNLGVIVVGSDVDDVKGDRGIHKNFSLDGKERDYTGLGGHSNIVKGYGGNHIGNGVTFDYNPKFNGNEVTVTTGSNGSDIFLTRKNPSGVVIGYKNLVPGVGNSIFQTYDYGFFIVGSEIDGDKNNIIMIKTDDNFNIIFNKKFGEGSNNKGFSGFETQDGGFILSGTLNNKLYVLKTDNLGNKMWEYSKGDNSSILEGKSIITNNLGDYLIVGNKKTISSNNSNMMVLHLSQDGNLIWDKLFTNISSGNSVIESIDGNFVITGVSDNQTGGVIIIKIDSFGNEIWKNSINLNGFDIGKSIIQFGTGGFYITGYTKNSSNYNLLLIKTDLFGNVK